MILSFKRLTQLAPVILLIIVAILISTYRVEIWDRLTGSVSETVEDTKDSISDDATESIVDAIIPDSLQGDSDDIEVSDDQVVVMVNNGKKEIAVASELAITGEEHMEGLMYREELCENCGMLFVFADYTRGGFWMKNCKIPLDILFIDEDGVIVDMKKDFEPCPAHPCPSYIPDKFYLYVLEVNGGWAEDNDVELGDTVTIPESVTN